MRHEKGMRQEIERPTTERYEIRVQGHLDRRWSSRLAGLRVTPLSDGETLLAGPVVDQAALQGILARIGDLGLTINLVRRVEPSDGSGA